MAASSGMAPTGSGSVLEGASAGGVEPEPEPEPAAGDAKLYGLRLKGKPESAIKIPLG